MQGRGHVLRKSGLPFYVNPVDVNSHLSPILWSEGALSQTSLAGGLAGAGRLTIAAAAMHTPAVADNVEMCAFSGRHRNIGLDDTAEMSADDAKYPDPLMAGAFDDT
jgi:hypothetical protein